MFQGIFHRIERTIDSVVAKYMGRAIVAVPLIIAGGFATAALTVKLVELYGAVTGYALMAALFAVLGVLTAAVLGVPSTIEDEEPEAAVSEEAAEEVARDVETLLTPELKAVLTTAAPIALPAVARVVLRNLPLVLLLAIAAYVVSRFADTADTADTVASGADAVAAPAT